MQTQRTTSAGYRLPLGETSAVHRIATRAEGTQTTASIKKPGSSQIDKCDEVAWNKIWREQVKNEWKGVQDWYVITGKLELCCCDSLISINRCSLYSLGCAHSKLGHQASVFSRNEHSLLSQFQKFKVMDHF